MHTEFKFLVRQQYDDRYFIQSHSHPCYELVYYLSGSGNVKIGDRDYPFSENTCVLSAPNEIHSESSSSPALVLFIGFTIDQATINEPLPEHSVFTDQNETILQKLLEIESEIRNKKNYYNAIVNILTENLVYLLLRENDPHTDTRAALDFSYILNYVESAANQRISVEQIAAALGYNYDYLRQLFLKKTGMTLKNYIMDIRLNNVQKYLLNYDYTLDELADITGFTSPSHLCMVFKRKFGLSPLEYKLKERKDPKVDNLKQ